MQYKILFLYTNEIIEEAGGVENVTLFYYNYYKTYGHIVHIIFWKKHEKLKSTICQYQLPNQLEYNSEINVKYIKDFILRNEIDFIISQTGIDTRLSMLAINACKNTSTKLITVQHMSPDSPILVNKYTAILIQIKLFKHIIYFIYSIFQKLPFVCSYKYLYNNSDAVVVLSPTYIGKFEKQNLGYSASKLVAIPNPLTQNNDFKKYKLEKENIILFVGRLDIQKRVDRLIKIWKLIEYKTKDWKLVILGDGIEREKIEELIRKEKLTNVELRGFQQPINYYKKSKVICLTSSYEGLPLVLLEAQQYGVIPIAFNTFSASSDLIKHGHNGFLIEPFNKKKYADHLCKLICEPTLIDTMSRDSISFISKFSIELISKSWQSLFKKLKG